MERRNNVYRVVPQSLSENGGYDKKKTITSFGAIFKKTPNSPLILVGSPQYDALHSDMKVLLWGTYTVMGLMVVITIMICLNAGLPPGLINPDTGSVRFVSDGFKVSLHTAYVIHVSHILRILPP